MKILEWVKYCSHVLKALSEGLQVVITNWPTDNPGNSASTDKKEVGDSK